MIRKRASAYHYEFMKDGKRYYGVCEGCTTQRAAEAYEKNIKETVSKASEQKNVKALLENFREELTGSTPILLSNAYEEYLRKPTKRQPGELQIDRNRGYWHDFLAFMAARHPDITTLAEVTKAYAEEYISQLRRDGLFDKSITFTTASGKVRTYTPKITQLSPRTINGHHKAIKAVFTRLKDDAGLLSNPFEIPTLDNKTTSREAFSDQELQLIGENMTMPYTRPIFTIGICTGLTLGDICLLKWSEISGNWITNKKRHKTGTNLDIPILPPLAAFFEEQKKASPKPLGEYVVPELAEMYQKNPSGIFYRVKNFLHSLKIETSAKEEGRRAVSTKAAHAMRHTFAYLAGLYNIPQPIVQGVLGHMSPEMTALYQKHALREQKERFFKNMPNVLGVSSNQTMALAYESDPERAELKALIDTLPLETVQRLLSELQSGTN